ncbi:hypothetical protein FI667_g1360, partial [Globisporangium splendens]
MFAERIQRQLRLTKPRCIETAMTLDNDKDKEPPPSPQDAASSPSSWASTSRSTFDSDVTLDDAFLDLEALALSAGSDYEDTYRRDRRYSSHYHADDKAEASVPGSGLPLVCSNCGVSFFSLQVTDDELECYCSGECKWSVIMYREMDRRMYALRHRMNSRHQLQPIHTNNSVESATYETSTTVDTESYESCHQYMDDVISCH